MNVGACSFNRNGPITGDIFVTKNGFVRIVGGQFDENKKIFCSKNLSLDDVNNIHLDIFDENQDVKFCSLIIRYLLPYTKICRLESGGSIDLSVFIGSFTGLEFIPGDEIELDGLNYIVFGCKGGYLWIKELGKKGLRFYNPRQINVKAKLVSRPTKNYHEFFSNV